MLLASLLRVHDRQPLLRRLSPTIETLIASRLIQARGPAAASCWAAPSCATAASGPEAPRAMAYMASSMAPRACALAAAGRAARSASSAGRSSFWLTAACGVAMLVAGVAHPRRNRAEGARRARPSVVRDYIDGFRAALRERRFIGLMIAATCASAGFNVFFGGPILLIQVDGRGGRRTCSAGSRSPGRATLSSAAWSPAACRPGEQPAPDPAGPGHPHPGCSWRMIVTAVLGFVTPLVLIVPLVLMGWGNGLNMPNAMANALASVPANRVGAASALMGFVQMIAAALLTLLIGYLPHDHADEHRSSASP